MRFFIFLLLVMSATSGYAQEAKNDALIDSLYTALAKATDDSTRTSIHYRLGRRLYTFNPDTSEYHAQEMIKLATASGNDYMLAKGLQLMGTLNKNKGVFDKALEYQLQALPLMARSSFAGDHASNLNAVGVLYKTMGDYEKALPYYRQSLAICQRERYANPCAMILNNIGTIHDALGNADSAMQYYQMGLDTCLTHNLTVALALSYNNIGEIYAKAGAYDSAQKYFLLTLPIDRATGNKFGSVNTYMNLGSSYYMTKDYALAHTYLDTAEAMAKELNAAFLLKNIWYVKHDVLEAEGNYRDALLTMERYSDLSDSLLNETKVEQMAEMEAKYETAKKEKELAIAERQKADLALEAQSKEKLALTIGLTALLVLGITGFYFYRRRAELKSELKDAVIAEKQKGLDAVIHATDEERKRIAKELHDGIAQTLSGLKLGFDSVQNGLTFNDDGTQEKYRASLNHLEAACDEIRTISHQMMPKDLSENGLVASIEDMLSRSLGNAEVKYGFECFGLTENDRFHDKIELSVYRICQEMVNNVMKHAGASEVNVQLMKNNTHLMLLVEDDGKGFDIQGLGSDGIGLMNIRSRAGTVHGEVSFEKGPSRGTVATVRIPLKNTSITAA